MSQARYRTALPHGMPVPSRTRARVEKNCANENPCGSGPLGGGDFTPPGSRRAHAFVMGRGRLGSAARASTNLMTDPPAWMSASHPFGPGSDPLQRVVLDAEALSILTVEEGTAVLPLLDVIRDEAVSGSLRLRAAPAIGVDPFAAVSGSAEDVFAPGSMLWREEFRVRFLWDRASGASVEGGETRPEHLQGHRVAVLSRARAWRLNV